MRHKKVALHVLTLVGLVLSLVGPMAATPVQAAPMKATTISFTGEELLGKPTGHSITINIVPASTIEYHYQYGTSSGSYTAQTANVTATGGQPHEVTITGLNPNTQYYYRMRYHLPGEPDWVERSEHSFWTQRATGSTFSFTVTSDSHANFNTTERNAMTNISNEHPDFEVDLGDTFMIDYATSQTAVNNAYLAFREPLYFDKIGNSVPIFLSSGNHENEEGWNLDDTFSIAQASIQARKLYFPTPIDDGFYSGNTDILAAIDAATYGDQLREDYYAWTWGDALFVVIDPFQYTMNLPYSPIAGEGSDDPVTGDQWSWTLGEQQFQWFKQTLENSDAKYKFVFSHQMTGGIPRNASGGAGYVRGGAEAAGYFEWGGKNADGSEGFADNRDEADFGTTPIHQLMVANGVSAYFHGHDHQYVYETRDGIVYQEVPSPGMSGSGFGGIYSEGDHGTYDTVRMLPGPGHLRITITPAQATVDYISSSSTAGTVNYSYTITPSVSGPTHTLTAAVSPTGGGTISPSAGDHTYAEGANVAVTATANPGYAFSGWSGACTGSGACAVTMDADKTVTANFIVLPPTCYALTLGHTGQGSDPTASPIKSAACAANGQYVAGESITLSEAAPATGWHIGGWTGTEDDASLASSNALTMPASAHAAGVTYSEDVQDVFMVVEPPVSTVEVGDTFSVEVQVAAGTQLVDGAEVHLTFDPDLLQVQSLTAGPHLPTQILPPVFDNGAGTIGYAAGVLTPTLPVAGTFDLLTITFVAQAATAGTGLDFVTTGFPVTDATFQGASILGGVTNGSVVIESVAPTCYALTLGHTGQGSDPAATPANSTGCAVGRYVAGESITLSEAAPATGWHIGGWTGTANDASLASTNALTMPASAHAAGVTYTQIEYTLTVNTVGSGSATRTPNQTTYHYGDVVTLTATAAPGWNFSAWSGDASGSTNPVSVIMNGNRTVTATFTQIEYTLTVNTVGSGTVTRNPNQTTYHYGDWVILIATPAPGWNFSAWSGDLTGSTNPRTITIDGNKVVTATFAQIDYTLTVNTVGSGTVTRSPSQATYHHGDVVTLTTTAATGWNFSAWSGDATGSTSPTTITIDGNRTVTATFTQIEYTLTVNTVGSGTVSRNPVQATYHYGDVVTLTATAATGWSFSAWSGDLTGTTSPRMITIDGNKVVTATFTQDTPAIRIDGEASLAEATVGEVITYTYSVQNTGNMALTGIQANDDQLGIIDLGTTSLLPGEMATGVLTYTVIISDLPGPITNTISVTATAGGYQVGDIYTITVQLKPAPSPSNTIIYLPIIRRNADR
jgi:uncharacterized repeat protein (TIGR01451 family)/uncharacterized repeat protein (TIGR02543 family)